MRILVLGASGRVGVLVVKGALARGELSVATNLALTLSSNQTRTNAWTGHRVTALVRDDSSFNSITAAEDALTIVKGQVQEQADVERAFAVTQDAPSAVLVTLNNARTSDNPFAQPTSPPTLMYDAHVNLLTAMKAHGTRNIITLQAHGVGDSFATLFFPIKLLVRYSNMGIGFQDHGQVERIVKQSGLNYVLVRPTRFVEGPSKGIHHYGDKGEGIGFFQTTTRESVANFMLDAVEKDGWNNTTPVISN